MSAPTVLVVDDDVAIGQVLCGILRQEGFSARHVASGEAALEALHSGATDCVLTDLAMPNMHGMDFLKQSLACWPDVPVIVLTAHGSIAYAVEAVKAGAADFLVKPCQREALVQSLQSALARVASRQSAPPEPTIRGPLLGESEPMRRLRKLVTKAAASTATVLVRGESGTGKELVADAIHGASERSGGPLVKVHCAALPESLLESELFGFQRGAFTGATRQKPGRVELAHGGTLLLDEIGDISLATQVKLLRLIQHKEFERLGDVVARKIDVRFVAATHRDLESLIARGDFRQDLYFRLNVIPVDVPPLRERAEDIPLLVDHFCRFFSAAHRRPVHFDTSALDLLSSYHWPGNVRELQSIVERVAVLEEADAIDADTLRHYLPALCSTRATTQSSIVELSSRRREVEREEVLRALDRANQNRSLAARLLGISRRTLYNKLAEYGIAAAGRE